MIDGAVQLALRERPQLERLDAPDEGVGHIGRCQQARRARQEKPARPAIPVDLGFDRAEQARLEMGFIDDQRVNGTLDERPGVQPGRLTARGVVERDDPWTPES